MKTHKPWFLYLVEGKDKSIYTGIAVDVEARYAAHNTGTGARYTRAHPLKARTKEQATLLDHPAWC